MNSNKPSSPLTDAQLPIMQIVWDHPGCSVREVVEHLAATGQNLARNTVLTQLTRLADKGWVAQTPQGRGFVYHALHNRDQTLGGMVQHLVDHAFSGSVDGLIQCLVDNRGLNEQEAARLKAIIDEGDRP